MTVVTPPVAANNLLAPVGAATPVGYHANGGIMLLDFVNDVGYFLEEDPTATGVVGIKKLTLGTTGTETLQATELNIFGDAGGGTPNHTLGGGSQCFHPALNKIFAVVDGISNSAPISCINASTLVSDYVQGTRSSSLSPSDDTRFLLSFQMIALAAGDTNYIVQRGLTAASHENEVGIFKVTASAISVVSAANITESLARLCAGSNGTDKSVASFYVIGDVFSRGAGTTDAAVFYEYLVHGTTTNKRTICSIAPATVDATWTNFSGVSNPGYDQADGNLLCFFTTLDSVTTQKYLLKINASTGAVMWRLAVTHEADLPNCNINGTLGIFNSTASFTLDLVNLANAAVTSQSWNTGFTTAGSQAWDYLSGSMTANLGYTQSTGTVPTYLGSYLAGHSNVIPSSRWGRLFTAQTYVVPDNPSPDADTAPANAWTFTLDGHVFYVLNLGDEGTFLYDITTKEWCVFKTTSTAPLWNMAVGTMWNSRVIAGDLSSNQVWELDPNATLDNATDEITRVVTGIITRRSRNFMSVGALRVACSNGALSGSGDSSLDLIFSDDQGNTWSSTFSAPLTSGSHSQEVAFLALGAFAAPGRVFQLSDTGGLVRISSADIDPENDDNEQPS